MLSTTYLRKIAVKYQTSDLNVRREYAQHILLSALYQQQQATDLFFKGGTALRLLYRSPRFSEDLDFDTTIHDQRIWEQALEQTILDASKAGMKIDIEESKTTAGGYLGIVKLLNFNDPILIRFEISFRKKHCKKDLHTIENDFITPYSIQALTTEELVEGKLHALFDRQKARDFYDLYYMLRANMLSPKHKHNLKKVLESLTKKKYNFYQELSIFLPKNQGLIIRDFKNSLTREIERSISTPLYV